MILNSQLTKPSTIRDSRALLLSPARTSDSEPWRSRIHGIADERLRAHGGLTRKAR